MRNQAIYESVNGFVFAHFMVVAKHENERLGHFIFKGIL